MPASARCAFFVVFCVRAFFLTSGVFAQEDTFSEEVPVAQEQGADAFTIAEQSISLGEDGVAAPANPTSVWNILRVLLTLAVVAVAVYGMVFFIKRTAKGNTESDPFLKILARTPLGVNRSAYVISVGSQAWLVGAAENGVNLIAEINEKEILDTMLLEESRRGTRATGPIGDFKALLGKLGMKVEAGGPAPEDIRKRSDRLKGL